MISCGATSWYDEDFARNSPCSFQKATKPSSRRGKSSLPPGEFEAAGFVGDHFLGAVTEDPAERGVPTREAFAAWQ
ncbi:hypothetical protein [Streptomyces sp. NBC_00483]|uniref:hypothetical protein n=1 Tax=Streptomyces sp. NBC_00483 TaxID=2975756 RepID=UPI002E19D698